MDIHAIVAKNNCRYENKSYKIVQGPPDVTGCSFDYTSPLCHYRGKAIE